METGLDRRAFLTRAAAMGGGLLSAAALERMSARSALADPRNAGAEPYGPLGPVADQRGIEVLALPAGFSYVTFGHIGTTMSDGNPTPLALDGMGAFRGRRYEQGRASGHIVRLMRNSEDRNPAGTTGGLVGDRSKAYDPTAWGGTTTLVFDERPPRAGRGLRVAERHDRQLRRRRLAPAPELDHRRGGGGRAGRGGPPTRASLSATATCSRRPSAVRPDELEVAVPIVAAGRFCARGGAPSTSATGIVYQTEDPGSASAPASTATRPDNPRRLLGGGALHMLAIEGQARRRPARGPDARGGAPGPMGADRRPRTPSCGASGDSRSTFNQGWAGGGAKFIRLEGCWEDESTIYFVSTSGGDVKNGDVNGRRYARGLRPGLGVPARRTAAGRSRSCTSRRPAPSWTRPTT